MSKSYEMFESGMNYQDIAEDFEVENAKLRKAVEYLYGFAKTCGVNANDLRDLGVEL